MSKRYTEKSIKRHQKAGYSPKADVRQKTFAVMSGMNTTEAHFNQITKELSEKIDSEREHVSKMPSETIKTYLNEWMDVCVVTMAGAMKGFQEVLFPTRVEADKVAVAIMDLCDAKKWDLIKDELPSMQLELEIFGVNVSNAAQDNLANLILMMEAYNRRRTAIILALRDERRDVEAVVAALRAEDEEVKRTQEELAAAQKEGLALNVEANEEVKEEQ